MSAVTPNRVAAGGGTNIVLTVNKPANWVNVTCDFNGIKVVPSSIAFAPYNLPVCFFLLPNIENLILFLFFFLSFSLFSFFSLSSRLTFILVLG